MHGGGSMPRKSEKTQKLPDVPWITEDGYIDLSQFPMDSLLAQAINGDGERLDAACRVLSSMAYGGRAEAGVFLYGLLTHFNDDRAKKEMVVEGLGFVKTRQSADLLFEELNRTESSNATRGYIKRILKALEGFPLELIAEGFDRVLSDPKWSYKMKGKFESILTQKMYGGCEEIFSREDG